MLDTIIIGGGPSAIAAAIYAARQKIKFVMIARYASPCQDKTKIGSKNK